MATHRVATTDPLRFDSERHGANGQSVNPVAFMRLADGFNHVVGRRRKLLLCRAGCLLSVPGGSSSLSFWPLYFRTGELGTSLQLYIGLAQSDTATFTVFGPTLLVSVRKASDDSLAGATTVSFNGQITGTTVQPNDIVHTRVLIDDLLENTEYHVSFTAIEGLRPVYLTAIEGMYRYLDDSNAVVCNPPGASSEAPILDGDMAALVTANNSLWRHNGTPLVSWTCDYSITGAPVTVSTSYTDLLTGDANTRRFCIPAQYHTTTTRTTVPVKMAVKADRPSGSGTCAVRLFDGTNSIAVTGIDNSATYGWYTATGTIPAATTSTWQIQALHSASAYGIQAVHLFPLET